MRTTLFSSLLFAFLTSLSVAASAAETPKADKVETSKPAATQAAKPAAEAGKVNLNTADASTLERELLGIGEVKAKAIIEYREANGPFASIDELLEVKGIGAATLEKNRDKLSIN